MAGLPSSKGGDGSMRSSWWPISGGMPKGLATELVQFNAFINDPDDRLDSTLGVFADGAKLGVALSVLEGRAAIQRGQAGETG